MKNFKLALMRYYDNVEFRKMNYFKTDLMLREVVGWIAYEDDEKIILISEKPATKNIQEVAKLKSAGFVILKSAIKEVVYLDA